MPTGNKRKEASSNKSLFQNRGTLGFTKKDVYINPSRPDLGRREKINLKFLFPHFLVVPMKATKRCKNKNLSLSLLLLKI